LRSFATGPQKQNVAKVFDLTALFSLRGGWISTYGLQEGLPTKLGQDAFAAIQEVVRILEADPQTDWSKVNIEVLRQHLIDMNSVSLAAKSSSEPINGGVRLIVTRTGTVADSSPPYSSRSIPRLDFVCSPLPILRRANLETVGSQSLSLRHYSEIRCHARFSLERDHVAKRLIQT
jgi:hypothetical protein